jgi:hypothetical protein
MYRKFDVTENFFYIVHFLMDLNTARLNLICYAELLAGVRTCTA